MKGENKEQNAVSASRISLAGTSIPTLPLILLLLLIGAAGALVSIRDHAGTVQSDPSLDPDVHFASCRLLAEKCTDITACGLNTYCGDGLFADCRVYDCGDNYGVATLDQAGQVSFKNAAKPADDQAVAAIEDRCSGTMEILGQDCVGEKTEMKLQLHTKGDCEIESFAVLFEEIGVQPSSFVSLGGGTYAVTAYACGKITQVIPAARGGIGLELPVAGA